ncbi:MAG: sugar transferase [Actinobacteria bacterium]|nr:sugar transferase [Actinomycetota bacterium]
MTQEASPQRATAEAAVVTPRRSWLRRRALTLVLLGVDAGTFLIVVWLLGELSVGSLVFGILLAGGFWNKDLYRNRLTLSILDDLPGMAGRFLMAAGFTLLLFEALPFTRVESISVWKWAALFVAMVSMRAVAYAVARRLRASRILGKTTLIVGCGKVGQALTYALQRERQCGLEPIGFVDSPPPGRGSNLPLPLLGRIDDLPELIERHSAEMVLVAYTHISEHDLVPIIRNADRLPASFAVVPRLFELVPVRGAMDHVSDIPLVGLPRPAFRSPLWPVKRIGDVIAAAVALILLSPLLLILGLINRVVDGPGVIFRQERIGVDGKPFELLKFRSLRPATSSESATKWNIKNDDRVSWYGKFLRKSSLDELPQLLNILRGDMAIVGPRPERPHFTEQFSEIYPYYGSRHRVPCGLTGWAQIHGLRGDTSIAGRARYDNFYIENWSLWLDFKIVLRTIATLTKGSG